MGLLDLFDAMEKKEEKVRLSSINITTSLDYQLFREDEKNVFLLDGVRYEIEDGRTLYVLEDKVYVDNRPATPQNEGFDRLLDEGEHSDACIDRFGTIPLSPRPPSPKGLRLLASRPAIEDDQLDRRRPLSVYEITDGRHRFPVLYYRRRGDMKRTAIVGYGQIELYGRSEDTELDVLSAVQDILDRRPKEVYFLPLYDGEYVHLFGRKRKITDDKERLSDPGFFVIEKGEHPIRKVKALFFLYLRRRIPEIGREMGLDLRTWEIKIGDYRSFFACNAIRRHYFCFDYRNVAFRKDVLDALLVHEISHCYHPNHGKAFYALCERYWPGYHYYDELLRRGVLDEKLLSAAERELYLPYEIIPEKARERLG